MSDEKPLSFTANVAGRVLVIVALGYPMVHEFKSGQIFYGILCAAGVAAALASLAIVVWNEKLSDQGEEEKDK